MSPYVGMARKQNGGFNASISVQTLIFHLVVDSIVWLLKAKKGSNVEKIGIVTILVSKYVKCFTYTKST